VHCILPRCTAPPSRRATVQRTVRHRSVSHFAALRSPNVAPDVSQVYSRCSNGYLFMLSPTPELWSLSLRHRTQIVFTLDASVISFRMHLKPGDVVVESGAARSLRPMLLHL
jgi:tRNA A58 N-methylase Trm61